MSTFNCRLTFYSLLGRFREFQSLRQGAAIPGISKEHVQAITLPVPPPQVQNRVISYLETVFAELEEMQKTQRQEKELLSTMNRAILAQAFEGKL